MNQKCSESKPFRGFTLIELMVATAVTVILLSILFSITTSSSEAFNRGKAKVQAARQAELYFDQLRDDFEAMVIRRGTKDEWFFAGAPAHQSYGVSGSIFRKGKPFAPPNICTFIMFTSAMDKYDGFSVDKNGDPILDPKGKPIDRGGDVCMLQWKLTVENLVNQMPGTESNGMRKADMDFQMRRRIAFPDRTYNRGIRADDTKTIREIWAPQSGDGNPGVQAGLEAGNPTHHLICLNCYAVSAVLNLLYEDDDGNTRSRYMLLKPNAGIPERNKNPYLATEVAVSGVGIRTDCVGIDPTTMHNLRIASIDVSITIIDDFAANYLTKLYEGKMQPYMDREEMLKKHSHTFTQVIPFPKF